MKKSTRLVSEKLFSKKITKANQDSLGNFKEYQKAVEILDKVRFPFGKQVTYRQIGASTTNTNTSFYGHTTG